MCTYQDVSEYIKVLRLQPGDILVVDPEKLFRRIPWERIELSFPVPIIMAKPEAFTVVRSEEYDG